MVTVTEFSHRHTNGDIYYSFKAIVSKCGYIIGSTFTEWMVCNADGVLMETAYGIDDDGGINCSPVVSIPKPCDSSLEPYTKAIHDKFMAAIANRFGIDYTLPSLCNVDDVNLIHELKRELGYTFNIDDFYKA